MSWTGLTLTGGMSLAISSLSRTKQTRATDEKSAQCKTESQSWKPTFDILNSGSRNRFTVVTDRGPLIVHNCGYEGGVGAFLTFAAVYNMDLDKLADAVWATATEDALAQGEAMYNWTVKKKRSTFGLEKNVWIACEVLKRLWRDAHPEVCSLWAAAANAMRLAVKTPGVMFPAGEHIGVQRDGVWTRVRLPSGRVLCYLKVECTEDGQLSYMGVNSYTRQWSRIKTYGGKLVENWTQAAALDVMTENMPLIEDSGYAVTLTVHDEILTETPDTDEYSSDYLAEMMSIVPVWAQGLPLSAAGFETTRYRKG